MPDARQARSQGLGRGRKRSTAGEHAAVIPHSSGHLGLPLTGLYKAPASNEHGCAPCEKADVPENALGLRNRLVDVMHPKHLVVDQALDHVEDAPTQQKSASQKLVRPDQMLAMGCAAEDEEPDHHEDIGRAVEDTVPK